MVPLNTGICILKVMMSAAVGLQYRVKMQRFACGCPGEILIGSTSQGGD